MSDHQACENTDRIIWLAAGGEGASDDYYADTLHITKDGALGINCGGSVYVKPIREWHRLAGGPIHMRDAAQCGVEWSDEDYKRARDCMRSILQDDYRQGRNPLLDLNFDNAFQHAVDILSLTGRALASRPPAAPVETEQRCAKCGDPTKSEEAWIDGQIWCHPCADEHSSAATGVDPWAICQMIVEEECYLDEGVMEGSPASMVQPYGYAIRDRIKAAKAEHVPAVPQGASMREALEDVSNWLEGCLQCKTWNWDGLQRDAAEGALKEARAALSLTRPERATAFAPDASTPAQRPRE